MGILPITGTKKETMKALFFLLFAAALAATSCNGNGNAKHTEDSTKMAPMDTSTMKPDSSGVDTTRHK